MLVLRFSISGNFPGKFASLVSIFQLKDALKAPRRAVKADLRLRRRFVLDLGYLKRSISSKNRVFHQQAWPRFTGSISRDALLRETVDFFGVFCGAETFDHGHELFIRREIENFPENFPEIC